jgi:signal transduction histidine kinase
MGRLGDGAVAGYGSDVTWLRTALGAADRRDVPLVAGLAVLLVADGAVSDGGRFTTAAIGAVALATIPLLWRRSAPQLVLLAMVAGVFACLATLVPEHVIGLPTMVAAYTVAVTGDRLRAAQAGVIVLAAAVGGVALYMDEGAAWKDALIHGVLLVLAVVTGDAVRARCAYRDSTRAREAERERERRAEALRMVAEERLRIAQEVHDVVAHAMVAISVQAGTAAHVVDRRPEQAHTALRAIKDASDAALTDLTRTLGLLRDGSAPAPLRPTEGLSGMAELAAPLRGAGIAVDVAIEGREDRVPAEIGAAAFRIAQEAATNILRHAGARRASITVEVGRDAVDVTVEDDGAALAPVGGPVEAGSGNGLRGMTERVSALGGRLDAGRRADGTWRVHAVLPLR